MIDNNFKNEKAPRNLGLYIHIPFCRTKCLYCDFCSFVSRDEQQREAYVGALLREIEARGTKDYSVDTVYFGGGTPSLLSKEQMQKIFASIKSSFIISDGAEITFEANPGTLTEDKALAFYNLGFNRVSVGLQSIHEKEMKKLWIM